MKIVVTGATGFIGSNLVKFYKDNGADVEIFTRQTGNSITETLEYFKPDIIINCAGEIYDESKMIASNIILVNDILKWMRMNISCRLIHLGSSSEYGRKIFPTSEEMRIDPEDLYSATKGAGTLLCQGYARKYKLDVAIARPYSVYGPGDRKFKLFHRMWKCFTDPKEEMEVYDAMHDWIYIDDFVRGIDILVRSEQTHHGDILNLGTGIMTSNVKIFEIFCDEFGFVPENVHLITDSYMKATDSNVWVADTTIAKHIYKFKPRYTIQQGIQQIKLQETND